MAQSAGTVLENRDIYRLSPAMDDATIATMADRLEFRASDEGYTRLSLAYFDDLPLATARQILALGCGTGVEVRALRQRPEVAAEITGVDHSPALIDTARRLTAEEGLSRGVSYETGDAQKLSYADGTFDIVLLHTLLSHVDDPLAILKEACRVTRPGGTVAIFDGDYASLTFAYPDTELATEIEEKLMSMVISNPRVMRDMPYLLHEAGLELVEGRGEVYPNIGSGAFWAYVPEGYATVLNNSGLLPADVIENWRAYQANAVETNTFFGASNFYTYLAEKPK